METLRDECSTHTLTLPIHTLYSQVQTPMPPEGQSTHRPMRWGRDNHTALAGTPVPDPMSPSTSSYVVLMLAYRAFIVHFAKEE